MRLPNLWGVIALCCLLRGSEETKVDRGEKARCGAGDRTPRAGVPGAARLVEVERTEERSLVRSR